MTRENIYESSFYHEQQLNLMRRCLQLLRTDTETAAVVWYIGIYKSCRRKKLFVCAIAAEQTCVNLEAGSFTCNVRDYTMAAMPSFIQNETSLTQFSVWRFKIWIQEMNPHLATVRILMNWGFVLNGRVNLNIHSHYIMIQKFIVSIHDKILERS